MKGTFYFPPRDITTKALVAGFDAKRGVGSGEVPLRITVDPGTARHGLPVKVSLLAPDEDGSTKSLTWLFPAFPFEEILPGMIGTLIEETLRKKRKPGLSASLGQVGLFTPASSLQGEEGEAFWERVGAAGEKLAGASEPGGDFMDVVVSTLRAGESLNYFQAVTGFDLGEKEEKLRPIGGYLTLGTLVRKQGRMEANLIDLFVVDPKNPLERQDFLARVIPEVKSALQDLRAAGLLPDGKAPTIPVPVSGMLSPPLLDAHGYLVPRNTVETIAEQRKEASSGREKEK